MTAVFKRVLASGAKLKISKCAFGYTRVEFLGHEVVAGQGVAVREAKVKAIVQCDRPQTAEDIKTFLGMSGFFRKFIPNYAEIASPLRALEKQVRTATTPITYEWQKKHQRCFDAIKAALVNADTLATPDYSKPFLLLTDASYRFLGAALVQIDDDGQARPMAYASTALVDAQKRYGITDLEGLAVVWSTRLWRHILLGSKRTVVLTDHAALTSLTSKKDLQSARLARYALDLSEFDLEFQFRPGKYHFLPDWLSRAELIDHGGRSLASTSLPLQRWIGFPVDFSPPRRSAQRKFLQQCTLEPLQFRSTLHSACLAAPAISFHRTDDSTPVCRVAGQWTGHTGWPTAITTCARV